MVIFFLNFRITILFILEIKIILLTISAHSHGDTFFQSAILAPVPVDPQDGALLIFGTRSVLDFLLDAASEETL